jgi:hypothetical protein
MRALCRGDGVMPSLNEAVPFWFVLSTVGLILVVIFIVLVMIKVKKEKM